MEGRISFGIALSFAISMFGVAYSAGFLESRVASLELSRAEAKAQQTVDTEWRTTILTKLTSIETQLKIYTPLWEEGHSAQRRDRREK